ncbi:MAG: glutamyl-tRNA reductase [Pseudomonadota bacterium]|jgi:glutamyl-tRNA reductase
MSTAIEPVIFCFGANHRSADIALREKLHADEAAIRERLPRIRDEFGFMELASLSTCNRFEIFGVGSPSLTSEPALNELLHRALVSFDMLDQEAAARVKQAAYSLTGREAVRHLFSVAASLDSLVVGETQITGQFKQAIAIAQQAQTLGPFLNRLGQDALSASKKVRARTGIGRGRVSIGNAAVDLARKVFEDPTRRRFGIIGAGEMGEVTAKCVAAQKPRELMILNRRVERARDLAASIEGATSASLDQLDHALAACDVLIVTTGASHPVVTQSMVKNALRQRRGKTLLLIDISLPRNIDPVCGTLDDVYLFDIDDLKQVVDATRAEREKAAEDAARIIDDSVIEYERWLLHMTLAPALKQFNDHVTGLFHREADRKFAGKTFNEDQENHLRDLLDILASRLTADAGRGLKQLLEQGAGREGASLLTRLFRGGDSN